MRFLSRLVLARLVLARSRDLTLGTFLERFTAVRGDRPLAEEPDGWRVTYAEAATLVARAADALRPQISPGDRVLIATPNGYRLLLACLATCRAGGIAVPVNPRMAESEIAHVIDDAGARVGVHDFDALVRNGAPGDAVRCDPASVAVLFYTSGTTGRPKGAELTHRALVGDTPWGALVPDVLLEHGCVTGLPIAHVAGFSLMLQLAAGGVPVYLLPHFRPTDVLDAIEQRRPLMFVGVPAMYRMMVEAGAADRDLSSVRLWSSGADTLPNDVVSVFQRKGAALSVPGLGWSLGRAAFVDGYGMAELAGGVAVRVFPPVWVPGAGLLRPLRGHEFRIVDEAGCDVAPGTVGELAVRGPGVMRGYHGRDDAHVFLPDGWLRTGDLARARGFGFYELAGRKKDVIKHGGYSVFAVEVERVLEEHPAVAEAAVVGLPDARKGEVPAAAVRVLDGVDATPDELIAFATERLSDYKVPQRVVVVDELPRTGTDKVNKPQLVQLFARTA